MRKPVADSGGAFAGFHPAVNFLYFFFVLLYTMFFLHPLCLVISLISAFVYSVKLNGSRALRFNLLFLLPLFLVCAVVNPAFNHQGSTILFYLHNGNPITQESIIFGLVMATVMVAAICWFSCYNSVMTSDKFIYLFGRIIPSLSLILSMVLRMVPRFKIQVKFIANAQRCIGRDISNGSIIQRIGHGIRILSILVTWALENAIDTADSMKSRGYGLPGRTAFSIFTWESRDKKALLIIGLSGCYVFVGSLLGAMYCRYFPTIKSNEPDIFSASVFAVYLLLCIVPLIIEFWEDRKWRYIQ